ncbi:MAG TPA: hypothetical protein VNO43_09715 [Candidatus Eisenbacteria bacterium]|nr:hypothetical protein [Candidatus Eisenbacteria bacterium]
MIKEEGPVLAGAITGRKFFTKLLDATANEPPTPEPLFLDFAGVDVATASFLRESVLAFRKTIRARRSNFYPIIANVNKVVLDEIAVLLGPRGDALIICSLDEKGEPYASRLLGALDPKQRITFDLVQKLEETEETNAAELYKDHEKDKIEQTAWNNRLSALAALGLIVELSYGRSKRYRPLLKGVEYGA